MRDEQTHPLKGALEKLHAGASRVRRCAGKGLEIIGKCDAGPALGRDDRIIRSDMEGDVKSVGPKGRA